MPPKRKRPSVTRAVRTALRVGNTKYLGSAGRTLYKRRRASVNSIQRQVNALSRTIETKEGCRRVTNFQCQHNNLTVLNDADGNVFNPFICAQNVGDPMSAGGMNRVGDSITVKRLYFKFFVEGSLKRSKVHFRFMLIRMAKGDTLDRSTFFQNACGNKMIDMYNKERFTIVAQKSFSVQPPNIPPVSLGVVTGEPTTAINITNGITGNRVFTMSVPGTKFGRDGKVTYENASTNQLKFYDYRLAVVAYDWYGTPQDTNNVGFINDGFVKIYFQDA